MNLDRDVLAFPTPDGMGNCYFGLTKLEWFAGQALIGLLGKTGEAQLDGEKTAAAAFAMARFMIRESRK